MKTIIGWLSDTHLDYQQYGLKSRRLDFMTSFRLMLEDMVDHGVDAMDDNGVDAIIHTGDLFNSARPSAEAVKFLQQMHEYLDDKGVPCYCITGNHDMVPTAEQWVDLLTEPTGGGGFRRIDYARAPVNGIEIFGYPSMSRERLIQHFKEDDLSNVSVLMLHQSVKELIGFPSPSAISLEEIPDIFPVVALGDIHVTDLRKRPSGGIIGYPGSTELNSVSESLDKHWVKLTFDGKELEGYEIMPGRSRPVLEWDVKCDEHLDAFLRDFLAQEAELQLKDARTPILLVKYPTSIAGVLDRVRQKLDPEKYIILSQPYFVESGVAATTIPGAEEKDISVADLLQSQVPADDAIFSIASALLNPDGDAKSALNEYVEKRLQEAEVVDV